MNVILICLFFATLLIYVDLILKRQFINFIVITFGLGLMPAIILGIIVLAALVEMK